jgi:hypothetical protein
MRAELFHAAIFLAAFICLPWRESPMNRLQLLDLLQEAKVQRDAAFTRRMDAAKAGNDAVVKEAEQKIADCNEVISDLERSIKALGG